MPKIAGYAFIDGVEVNAYKATRFAGTPAHNDAPPAGAPDAGPVFTGDAFGGTGLWELDVPTAEDYRVSYLVGTDVVWLLVPAGGGGSGGGTFAGLSDVSIAGILDGQGVVWNGTLSKLQPTALASAGANHADNTSYVAQTVQSTGGVGTRVDLSGVSLTGLASPGRAGYIEASLGGSMVSLGASGSELWMAIVETTGGGAVDFKYSSLALPFTMPPTGARAAQVPVAGRYIAAFAGPRSFKLQAWMVSKTAETSRVDTSATPEAAASLDWVPC